MKNKKGVIFLVAVIAILLTIMFFQNNKLTKSKEVNIYVTDSLLFQINKQDSLIAKIQQKEDSLLQRKTDTINKIREVYEKRTDSIINLTPDEQVKLLTRNLSEDFTDKW